MRVLIFGSRVWSDVPVMETYIYGLGERHDDVTVIHGNQRGADQLAGSIATDLGYEVLPFDADWPVKGSPSWAFAKAGHDRNQRMLDEGKPEIAVGFKNFFDWSLSQGGSENMAKRCKVADVPCYIVSRVQ